MRYRLNINGAIRQVDVPAEMPLLWVPIFAATGTRIRSLPVRLSA